MSTDNLILTEHSIKRHAKRLQKQMKNYSKDLSLGESQNFLSKILGFNDWNHLNTILKPAIKEYEKNFNTIKDKAQKQDDLINSVKTTQPKTFLVYNLDLSAECFSDTYIDNLIKEPYNQKEDFIELKNNFESYEKQNKDLDDLNLEFAKILSTFPGYIIRGNHIFSEDHLLQVKRNQAIVDIISFTKNNQHSIDFNTVSKEGLNLLVILLIFSARFEQE